MFRLQKKTYGFIAIFTMIGLSTPVVSQSGMINTTPINNVSYANAAEENETVRDNAPGNGIIANSIDNATIPLKFPTGTSINTITNEQILDGIVAYDENGDIVSNDRLRVVRDKSYSPAGEGRTVDYRIILLDSQGKTVVDKYGMEVSVVRKVLIGEDWGDLVLTIIRGGDSPYNRDTFLQVKHFKYDGTTVTSFSLEGRKLFTYSGGAYNAKTITMPLVNMKGEIVETVDAIFNENSKIGTGQFNELGEEITINTYFNLEKIESWGNIKNIKRIIPVNNNKLLILPPTWENVERIGENVFSYTRLKTIPSSFRKVKTIGYLAFSNNAIESDIVDWGYVESVGYNAFSNNKIKNIPDYWPDSWTKIDTSVFYNNEISKIPKSWNNIEQIHDYAFANNVIGSVRNADNENDEPPIPLSWENVNVLKRGAFQNNKLLHIPDDWGQITRFSPFIFQNNELQEIPKKWRHDGDSQGIGRYAFQNNQIREIPTEWDDYFFIIGRGAFADNLIEDLPDDWKNITLILEEAFANNNLQADSLPKSWGETFGCHITYRYLYGCGSNKTYFLGQNAFSGNPQLFENEDYKNGDGFKFSVYGDDRFLVEKTMLALANSGIPQSTEKPIRLYPTNNSRNGVNDLDTVKIITIPPEELEIGGGWLLGDFTYGDGINIPTTTVTGFTQQGLTKLINGKTDLYLPTINPVTHELITTVGERAFSLNNDKAPKITSISGSWNDIEIIGKEAFYNNNISKIPSKWGKVKTIENSSFHKNKISRLPVGWELVEKIGNNAFSYNKILKLPEDWGYDNVLTHIGDYAFENNKINNLPEEWGAIENVGKGAFKTNNIPKIPQKWEKINTLNEEVFANNNIKEINSWEGITTVNAGAFVNNPIEKLPKDFGTITNLTNTTNVNNVFIPVFGTLDIVKETKVADNGVEYDYITYSENDGDFTNTTLLNHPDFVDDEGFGLVFTMSDDNISDELRDAIEASGLPKERKKPIVIYTHNFLDENIDNESGLVNPKGVKNIDNLLINPTWDKVEDPIPVEYVLPHTGGAGMFAMLSLSVLAVLGVLIVMFRGRREI